MHDNACKKKLTEAIETAGFEVVELRKEQRSKLDIIKIFIDKKNGITLKDCKDVSRLVNDVIFKYDLYKNEYRLEVSSPGVDRPLQNVRDFRRNISRRVQVEFEESGVSRTAEGKIISADDKELVIEVKKEEKTIPMANVTFGKILLPW